MKRANEESVVVCKKCGFEFNFTKVRVKVIYVLGDLSVLPIFSYLKVHESGGRCGE